LSTTEIRHAAVLAGFTAKLMKLDDGFPPPSPRHDRHLTVRAATDLLAARLAITPDDALVLLRAHAYAHDRPLHHIAEAVIHRRLWSTSLDDDSGH
jgi:ANTAR domain